MDKETALSELKAICAVISDVDGSVPQRYISPWRGELGSAFAVVAPENIPQIQSLMNFAVKNNFRLLPQGQMTGLIGASVPAADESDSVIVLTLERYRNQLEYNEVDRRVRADAGFTLDEVNEYLKPFGVHVPINVSSNPMIGGAIATNIGGSRVLKYGDARKLLLGVEVVLADEERSIYSTLDKPRKDNSSPDFTGVFCGSFGSYGVITAGSFDTFPIYQSTYTAWFAINKNAKLEEFIYKIQSLSSDLLLACEFIGSKAVEVVAQFEELKSSFPLSSTKDDVIFVEWGSSHHQFEIEEFAEKILEEISESGLVDDISVVPPATTWSIRHLFSQALRDQGKLVGNDVSVSKDKISEFLEKVDNAINEFDPTLVIRPFGHLGDGGIHLNVIAENKERIDSWTLEDSQKVWLIVGEIASSMGGSFSAEHGLGSFNSGLYEKLVSKSKHRINSGFKKVCDPNNILGHSGIKF